MMRSIFGLLISPLFVLFVVWPEAWAQLNDFDRQEFTFENALAGKNPGFESGTVQWTASGGTFAVNSGTQIVPNSKQFATWDSNSAGQTLQTAAVTVPKTGNCEFSIWIAVPSGTATHTITVTDGTNDLVPAQTITTSANALKHIVNFPCPSSGTVRGKLTSVASNEPSISLDNGRLGSATNVGVADLITESTAFTPTGSLTTNATYTGRRWRVGDRFRAEMTVSFSGTNTQGELTFNLPSDVVIDTSKLTLGTSTSNYSIGSEGQVVDSGSNQYFIFPYYKTTTTIGVRYKRVSTAGTPGLQDGPNVDTSVNAPITIASGDSFTVKVDLPVVGWSASQVIMPNAQGWFASGFISGANPGLGNTAVSTYTEIANGSLSLTANTGSASVGVACSSTNASTVGSSTCSAGNEVIGITTNIPTTGVYEACFQFGHVINIGGAAGSSMTTAFQVVETANSSGTVTQEANGRVTSGAGYEGGSNSPNQVNPVMVCGTLSLNAGQRLIKVYYEQAIPSGTIITNEIQADASATVGQRNIYFIVRPVNSQQQAILANSVSSTVANGTRIESAAYPGGVSSCGTITQVGDWIQSCTRNNTGNYTVTFKSGIWSSAPQCQVTPGAKSSSSNTMVSYLAAPTTSSFQILLTNEVGTEADGYFSFTCHGNR